MATFLERFFVSWELHRQAPLTHLLQEMQKPICSFICTLKIPQSFAGRGCMRCLEKYLQVSKDVVQVCELEQEKTPLKLFARWSRCMCVLCMCV